MINVLYITYDGLSDPLGQSQILPYITGLTSDAIEWTILSFEKLDLQDPHLKIIAQKLSHNNTTWIPKCYHRYFSSLSKIYDLANGLFTIIFQGKRYDLIFVRSYVAATLGYFLKKIYRSKFIFDMRGFWPEEKIEGGDWKKKSLFYMIAKFFELRFIRNADSIIVLTYRGKEELLRRYPSIAPIEVIPTCVDQHKFSKMAQRSLPSSPYLFCYSGSLGTWYCLDEMVNFIKYLRGHSINAILQLLINDTSMRTLNESIRRYLQSLKFVKIESCAYDEVPYFLSQVHFGLYFIRATYSKLSSCPTKLGEFLSMGIPIITNRGIGDCDGWIEENSLGILVDDFSVPSYQKAWVKLQTLIEDPYIGDRCVQFAKKNLSLQVGVSKYKKVLQSVVPTMKLYSVEKNESM